MWILKESLEIIKQNSFNHDKMEQCVLPSHGKTALLPFNFQMFLNTRNSQIDTSVSTHSMDSGVTFKCVWDWSGGETFSKPTLCPADR